MTCDEVRQHLLDYQRGRSRLETQQAVRAHLDGCAGCTRADTVEQELTRLLEQRLPQHPASLALKRQLAARWSQVPTGRSWWSRWRSSLVPALAAAAAVFVYARRLHPISLLVFRADGVPWPSRNLTRIGGLDTFVTSERGFNVIVWRRGELGYALVSDVDGGELRALASRMTSAP